MFFSSNTQWTTRQLLDRGWTRTLIRRFLPDADGKAPVDHWANFQGTPAYNIARVVEIEQSEDFGIAFLRSWKGRMKGRKAEQALAALRATATPGTNEEGLGEAEPR
jgi:hypothetical protein